MKEKKQNKKQNQTDKIQWHSAFRGAIKTEFSNETIPLEYREEHSVTKKPLNVDLIVIQKNRKEKLHNTIGHIFRTFNIIEYKGPDDTLSINDFYKVYAYACIFKSDSTETIFPTADEDLSCKASDYIPAEELTITMASSRYPRALISHLKNVRHYTITEYRKGIYYVTGDFFPIQIVVHRQLLSPEHAWLKSLTKNIDPLVLEYIMEHYDSTEKNEHKDVVVDAIIKGNQKTFHKWKERYTMSGALLELFKPELEALAADMAQDMAQNMAQDMAQNMAQDMAQGMAQDMAQGMAQDMAQGMAQDMAQIQQKDAKKKIIQELLKNGVSIELVIKSIPDIPPEEIQEIYDEIVNR